MCISLGCFNRAVPQQLLYIANVFANIVFDTSLSRFSTLRSRPR